jgi:hypothetical protein
LFGGFVEFPVLGRKCQAVGRHLKKENQLKIKIVFLQVATRSFYNCKLQL